MPHPPTIFSGVVTSAGKMMKAVRVRTSKQVYNRFLKKYFQTYQTYKVSDPNSSVRQGDVIKFSRCKGVSRKIPFVVQEIMSPWGLPLDERPKVLSEVERRHLKDEKHERRRTRKAEGKAGEAGEGEVLTES